MPRTDSYWWLGAYLGAFFGAAGLALTIYLAIWYQSTGSSLAALLDTTPSAASGLWLLELVIFCAIPAAIILPASLGARRRARLRRIMIQSGREGAGAEIPLARILVDPTATLERTADPLIVEWRTPSRLREAVGPLALFASCIALGGLLFNALNTNDADAHLSGPPLWLSVQFGLILAIVAAVALATLIARLFSRRGPAYGVIADDEGIATLYQRQRGPQLSWQDARLLEAIVADGATHLVLQGPVVAVEWRAVDSPGASRRTSADALSYQRESLLALAHAWTGLVPRTLNPSLRAR